MPLLPDFALLSIATSQPSKAGQRQELTFFLTGIYSMQGGRAAPRQRVTRKIRRKRLKAINKVV